MKWLIVLCLPSLAHAQLRDPVPADLIRDGAAVAVSAGALAEAAPARADEVTGELALVATWTRAGVDYTEGLRGPRWTKRWGAAFALVGRTGSVSRELELEQRGEVALYVGSIGQTVRWRAQPRLTDRVWRRAIDEVEVGGFVDFGGIGLVKRDPGGDLSCEGFPFQIAVARTAGAAPITTTQIDLAVARVAGERGDLRIIDETVTIHDSGELRAFALDAAAFSARAVEIAPGSPWRVSGALGISGIFPWAHRDEQRRASSVIPLLRVGIERRGTTQLRSTRSEIGRPLLDDTDIGVELASLHRMTETAVDAGGQLTAWFRRALSARVTAHGETMLGVGRRQLVFDGTPAKRGSGAVVLVRGEVGIAAHLGGGLHVDTRAWAEHSDRTAPVETMKTDAPRRWDLAVMSGLSWRR